MDHKWVGRIVSDEINWSYLFLFPCLSISFFNLHTRDVCNAQRINNNNSVNNVYINITYILLQFFSTSENVIKYLLLIVEHETQPIQWKTTKNKIFTKTKGNKQKNISYISRRTSCYVDVDVDIVDAVDNIDVLRTNIFLVRSPTYLHLMQLHQ